MLQRRVQLVLVLLLLLGAAAHPSAAAADEQLIAAPSPALSGVCPAAGRCGPCTVSACGEGACTHAVSVNNAASNNSQVPAVLQVLERARAAVQNSTVQAALAGCCRRRAHVQLDLQPVLAEVAMFPRLRSAAGWDAARKKTSKAARELLLTFRAQLAQQWLAALQPAAAHVSSGVAHNSTGCGCRSVRLPPFAFGQLRRGAGSKSNGSSSAQGGPEQMSSTALLLVVDSWQYLERSLTTYSLHLFMLWAYASMHGYDIQIYVHGSALPPWMSVYFVKLPGVQHMMDDWGYSHVLYTDWDVLLTPRSAPPLSRFFDEAPAASLLLQGEKNLCAGVGLWRNTPDAAMLLRAWWELGAAGCCAQFPGDQTALKHIVAAMLANVTGDEALYGPRDQRHFALPDVPPACAAAAAAASGQPPLSRADYEEVPYTTAPPQVPVSTLLHIQPTLLEQRSAVGLVALDVHSVPAQGAAGDEARPVALTSCLEIWPGCVPGGTPALLYHTGHTSSEKLDSYWLPLEMLAALADWGAAAGLSDTAK